MSEELRRGIPKAIPTGEQIEFTEEEKRWHTTLYIILTSQSKNKESQHL